MKWVESKGNLWTVDTEIGSFVYETAERLCHSLTDPAGEIKVMNIALKRGKIYQSNSPVVLYYRKLRNGKIYLPYEILHCQDDEAII